MPDIPELRNDDRIISEDGYMSSLFQKWMREITDLDLIIGTGSPEGVVEATKGRLYMDDNGTTGSILYIKKLPDISGNRTQGWIAV